MAIVGKRQFGTPLLLTSMEETVSARLLERVELVRKVQGTDAYDEGWLQKLIHRFPQTLPVSEIEPRFVGLAPICLELPTPAGFVDNLFMTSAGDLVIAECKLWRNPEARREVVAQIIDYAHSLSKWSYEDLERAVGKGELPGGGRPAGSLFELALGGEEPSEGEEAAFIDAVSKNLRLGRLLLLVVGDGIREGVETLADYLQVHAGFHFTLAIVEVAVSRMPEGGGYLVQPRVLARTLNIERGVVRVEGGTAVVVAPALRTSTTTVRSGTTRISTPRATTLSEEQFYEEIATSDPMLPDRLRIFLDVAAERGVFVEFGRSLQLRWEAPNGIKFNLGLIKANGMFEAKPVGWEPVKIGRLDLAHGYLEEISRLIGAEVVQTANPANWYVSLREIKCFPPIQSLLDVQDAWIAAIERYTASLSTALNSQDD